MNYKMFRHKSQNVWILMSWNKKSLEELFSRLKEAEFETGKDYLVTISKGSKVGKELCRLLLRRKIIKEFT